MQPLTILITSFAIILLVFNVLLKLFLAEEAFTAIQNQYDTLDALYVGEICQKFQMVTSLKLLMPSLMKSLTSNIFQHQPMIYLKSKFLRKSLITFQITSRLIGLMMNLIIVRSILKGQGL